MNMYFQRYRIHEYVYILFVYVPTMDDARNRKATQENTHTTRSVNAF
jgi:hypothetical protein